MRWPPLQAKSTMSQSDREDSGVRDPGKQKMAKDERHTPYWDRKIQREFEAKNPGPPKKRSLKKKVCVTISDDEPDEELGKWEMIGRWTSGTNW